MDKPKPSDVPALDMLTVDALDRDDDTRAPDASVAHIKEHARNLAETLRAQLAGLTKARLSEADAVWLLACAELLQTTEDAWLAARRASPKGVVAEARDALTDDRMTLFLGLEAFDNDPKLADELADIAGVEDDDDLAEDSRRLLKLGYARVASLADTEITEAFLDSVRARLQAFEDATRGVVDTDDGTTRQVLSEAARVALGHRNRVFWALAGHCRKVCMRAQFAFRKDPVRRGLFASYLTVARRRRALDVAPALAEKPPVPPPVPVADKPVVAPDVPPDAPKS